MLVKDVMTSSVVSVAPNETVEGVARTLLRHRISAVPVVDGDRLVGIVSEGDLMRRYEEHGAARAWWLSLLADRTYEFLRTHGTRARDVMTREVITVSEDTNVERVAEILEARHIKWLPVVREGRLVGIVSRADILRGLAARGTAGAAAPSESDRDLRDRILRDIEKRAHAPAGSVAVIVVRGSAYLWGIAQTQQDKETIRAAAEEVVGTQKVHDFLSALPGVLRRAL